MAVTPRHTNCRPGERRDPYAVPSLLAQCQSPSATTNAGGYGSLLSQGRRVGRACAPESSSPSLPWRDDLDLVAGLQRRLGPAALRQHVVIQRDREMAALVVEFTKQRIDAGGPDLAGLAVDDHAHCITSLSIWPHST